MTDEEKAQIPAWRLRDALKQVLQGRCHILSEGSNCKCPLCDLDRLYDALRWYEEEARALSVNMQFKKDTAVLASVQVLALDAGNRSLEVLGPIESVNVFKQQTDIQPLPEYVPIIKSLLDVAKAAFHAADDSEETDTEYGIAHLISSNDFDELSSALDVLEKLPDDKPGYTLSGPGRAEWALRGLLKPWNFSV